MQKVPFFVSWCFLFFLVTPGDGYASGDICINFCVLFVGWTILSIFVQLQLFIKQCIW